MRDTWTMTLDYRAKLVIVRSTDPDVPDVVIPFSLVEARSLTVTPSEYQNGTPTVAINLMVDTVERIGLDTARTIESENE